MVDLSQISSLGQFGHLLVHQTQEHQHLTQLKYCPMNLKQINELLQILRIHYARNMKRTVNQVSR